MCWGNKRECQQCPSCRDKKSIVLYRPQSNITKIFRNSSPTEPTIWLEFLNSSADPGTRETQFFELPVSHLMFVACSGEHPNVPKPPNTPQSPNLCFYNSSAATVFTGIPVQAVLVGVTGSAILCFQQSEHSSILFHALQSEFCP